MAGREHRLYPGEAGRSDRRREHARQLHAGTWLVFRDVDAGRQEDDTIPFGVGDVYVIAGQSNAVSPPQDFPAMATAPGKVIVSDVYGQGIDMFLDAGVAAPDSSTAWVHMGNYLDRPPDDDRQRRGRKYKHYDWVQFLFARLRDSVAYYKPTAIIWHQGESDCTTPPRTDSFTNTDAMVDSLRQLYAILWIVAKNSTSYPLPDGYTEWPIRAAQPQLDAKWDHVY
jgi:hypothetical protein